MATKAEASRRPSSSSPLLLGANPRNDGTAHFVDLIAVRIFFWTLSLQEIIRFAELSSSQVKNCLLVLIQHNCVPAFFSPRPAGLGVVTKAVTHYMALFDNILDRMGFSKFLAVVSDDLCPQSVQVCGKGCVQILIDL
uniref:DNA-directed RNA polymerase III subunit RPC3 n=1 Tax=Elaeis guineensis var. tenera TaxID=51953 RepID=A0A8N4EY56_ELAGV|nr:uncharacterized protein LOC114913009 [Elaeis guineensis]